MAPDARPAQARPRGGGGGGGGGGKEEEEEQGEQEEQEEQEERCRPCLGGEENPNPNLKPTWLAIIARAVRARDEPEVVGGVQEEGW